MKPKAIIFDFDGVICDTFESVYEVCKKFNNKITKEDIKKIFDGGIFNKIKYAIKLNLRQIEKENGLDIYKDLKLNPAIKKELIKLSKNSELYIITANSIKNIKLFFVNNNFKNNFKKIYSSEHSFSKIKKFKMLFKDFNLKPEECLFITDTLGDIKEANKVGVKTIAVDFGYHERSRLEKGRPFEIISKFEDIKKTIT
jgi:phosphoglycolate phosphatase